MTSPEMPGGGMGEIFPPAISPMAGLEGDDAMTPDPAMKQQMDEMMAMMQSILTILQGPADVGSQPNVDPSMGMVAPSLGGL